jgi:hypothetical protein
MDLALLTAQEIAMFLDPENQALELRVRRDPQTHIFNPEASLPDPRTDPTVIQLLHAWAESGVFESGAATLPPARETTALKGIKRVSMTVEDTDSSDNHCKSTNDGLRLAAIRPITNAGLKVVTGDLASPALYLTVTAASIGTDRCAAFISVALRSVAYLVPGYQRIPRAGSSKLIEDASFLTSGGSEFAERVMDQVRRRVDGVVTQIALANQGR